MFQASKATRFPEYWANVTECFATMSLRSIPTRGTRWLVIMKAVVEPEEWRRKGEKRSLWSDGVARRTSLSKRVTCLAAILSAGTVALAGCSLPAKSDETPVDSNVNGDSAFAFVEGLITNGNGTPRFRVPGTPGHDAAAEWLWDNMQVDGWTRARQNFTGADYVGLEKGGVTNYYASPGYCSAEEKARLGGLSFSNLWAVHATDSPSGRLVLLGAHWESKRFASSDPDPSKRGEPVLGANDGASGVGLLLELMRHVTEQQLDLPFDLGIAFFDGEDGFEECHPLAGSLYFVSQLETGQVDRFLLLDMVGDSEARFIRESRSEACDPVAVNLLHEHAAGVGLAENFPGTSSSVFDDHLPFLEAGIPAVDLIDFGRGFPPYWHTTQDTVDKLSASMLGRVGDLVLAVLADPEFADPWPAPCV